MNAVALLILGMLFSINDGGIPSAEEPEWTQERAVALIRSTACAADSNWQSTWRIAEKWGAEVPPAWAQDFAEHPGPWQWEFSTRTSGPHQIRIGRPIASEEEAEGGQLAGNVQAFNGALGVARTRDVRIGGWLPRIILTDGLPAPRVMIVGSECGYFDRMRGVIQDLADAAVTWKFLGAATSDDRVTLSFEERRGVTRWIELQMSPEPQLMAVRGRCQADDGSDRWEEEIRLSDWQERAGAILPWRMVYRTSSWGTGDGAQSDDAALAHTASVSVLQRISLEPLEASLQSEFEEILEAGPGTKIEDRRHGITYMLGSSEMSGACGALTGSEIPDVLSDPTGWIRAARPQSSDGPPWWLDFIHP